MARSDRCPTASGAFRCDFATGHTGPCETVQPATAWVGPATRMTRLASQTVGARPDSQPTSPTEEVPRG